MKHSFTDRTQRALNLAMHYAEERGDPFLGTEHLLMGLVREGGGVAAKVLSYHENGRGAWRL